MWVFFKIPWTLLRTITLITFQEQNKSLIIILQHQNWGLNIHSTPLSVGIKLCYSVVRRIIEAQFWHKVHPSPHSATSRIRSAPRSRWRNSSLSGSHRHININIIAANYLPSHMAQSWRKHLCFIPPRYVSVYNKWLKSLDWRYIHTFTWGLLSGMNHQVLDI